MNKRLKFWLVIFLFTVAIAIGNCCYGKSYSIDNMDIQATIESDGSVNVKQKMTYTFEGNYNGVYVTIPYALEDSEYDAYREQSTLKDSLYNNSGVEIHEISSSNVMFTKQDLAENGQNGVYSVARENGILKVKIFSPSKDETKNFELNYTLQDVCVKHDDVGELYYNFIGGSWDETIKNLNIDIYVNPANTNLKIWGHGNYNGVSTIQSNSHANFKTSQVKPNEYVAVRMLFDLNCIPNCTKTSGIAATDLVLQDEAIIGQNRESKQKRNQKTAIFCFVLFVYWMILLFVYEIDKKYKVTNFDEQALFQKYNPLVAGCLQGSRDILSRDIIAVVLSLIHKKIIILKLLPKLTNSSKEDQYLYEISKNPKKEKQMDKIERYIYHWIFKDGDTVNLTRRLEVLPKEAMANEKFKQLDVLCKNSLQMIGANRAAVPMMVRVLNNILLVITLIWATVSVHEIVFNVFNVDNLVYLVKTFGMIILMLLPVIMAVIYFLLWLVMSIRRKVVGIVQKHSGKRLVTTTITILLLDIIFMTITGFFVEARGLILDELLVSIALIICLTDNLMLKNSVIAIEDFSKLNCLKDKIQDYTLSDQRDIEQIFLWDQYLAYAVSFGVAKKIMGRIQAKQLDDDLMKLAFQTSFYGMIANDFGDFYRYNCFERRFLDTYWSCLSNVTELYGSALKNMGNDGGSGSGGGFSGGSGFHRWRRTRSVAGGAF